MTIESPLKNGFWNERPYSFSSFKESMLKSYIEISQVLLYMGVEIHLAKIRLMSDSDSDVSGNTFFRGELEKSLFLWHSLRQIGAKAEHHCNFHLHHLHLHKLIEINKKKKERSSILHLYISSYWAVQHQINKHFRNSYLKQTSMDLTLIPLR